MIFLFLACPVVQETPEPSWELPTTDAPLVYWEGLDDPRGLARYGETLWVAEHGGGRILTVENEVMEVVAEDLEGPWMVAASEAGWAFVERDGGRVWAARSGEEASVLAEDLVSPGRITMEGSRVCWVEEGESARVGCGDVDSGEVVRAVHGVGVDHREVDTHPDTGATIVGTMLPDWQAAKALCLKHGEALSGIKLQAWDIAMCPAGPVIMEVNSSPGLQGIETATGKDIAGLIVEHLEKNASTPRKAPPKPKG